MPKEEDFEALGREQLGYPIKSLPRYTWLQFPSADNNWLGTNWSATPEVGLVCLRCPAALYSPPQVAPLACGCELKQRFDHLTAGGIHGPRRAGKGDGRRRGPPCRLFCFDWNGPMCYFVCRGEAVLRQIRPCFWLNRPLPECVTRRRRRTGGRCRRVQAATARRRPAAGNPRSRSAP